MLAEAHRKNPTSEFRRFTLFAAILGERPAHGPGEMPDIEAARQYLKEFPEGPFAGDVAIILDRGKVVQKGDPEDVFRKPGSAYIADFLGAEDVFAGHGAEVARLAGGHQRRRRNENAPRAGRRLVSNDVGGAAHAWAWFDSRVCTATFDERSGAEGLR